MTGYFDRRRGKPSPKRVPLATVETVLGLYRQRYFDLNVSHFYEKLKGQYQIDLSYTWVKAELGPGPLKERHVPRTTPQPPCSRPDTYGAIR